LWDQIPAGATTGLIPSAVALIGRLKRRACEGRAMVKYDLLVYLGLVPAIASTFLAIAVMILLPANAEIEIRKMRLAGAAMVCLFSLFIFAMVLYFVDPDGPGREIFEKAFTAILTLMGTIIGYVFGAAKN
jgi:hypothetical protein